MRSLVGLVCMLLALAAGAWADPPPIIITMAPGGEVYDADSGKVLASSPPHARIGRYTWPAEAGSIHHYVLRRDPFIPIHLSVAWHTPKWQMSSDAPGVSGTLVEGYGFKLSRAVRLNCYPAAAGASLEAPNVGVNANDAVDANQVVETGGVRRRVVPLRRTEDGRYIVPYDASPVFLLPPNALFRVTPMLLEAGALDVPEDRIPGKTCYLLPAYGIFSYWQFDAALSMLLVSGGWGLRRIRRDVTRTRNFQSMVVRDNDDARVGSLVGRWLLLERLGQGGMATVYRAIPTDGNGDEVAIKMMHASLAGSPQNLQRFKHEVRACMDLQHPAVVGILDWNEEPLYLVMELVRGRSLRSLIRPGGLALAEAWPLLREILEAVAWAHERGIVHRDLKPDNIMVLPGNHVKIMDFGLAKGKDYSTLTSTGTVMGTPNYLPTELLRGHQAANPLMDQYSLGVTAYEILCGQLPYAADSVASLFYQRLSQEPPSLRDKGCLVPPAFDAAVLRMMAKDADRRFPDLRAALAALEQAARQ